MKKLISADTVDSAGNAWETVGENIRNGAKDFSNTDMRQIIDMLFPIGTIYCGENEAIRKVGTWKVLSDLAGRMVVSSKTIPSGSVSIVKVSAGDTTSELVALRFWKRVG